MNLLVFNIRTDLDDTALGFTTAWTNALARRCSHVDVVAMRTGRLELAANVSVHSLEFDRHPGRLARISAFYRTIGAVLRARRIDACFAHMTPLLAVLFTPIARMQQIPVLLWYAHGATPVVLRIADRLVDRSVSSTPSGYRISSRKVHFVNQGIDTDRFHPPVEPHAAYRRTAVLVGRVTPVKHVDEVIEAVALARARGLETELDVFGGPVSVADAAYASDLERLVETRGLRGHVRLRGPVPFGEIPSAYHRGIAFPSLSMSGSLDKALLEAMASGCVPLSRNDAFRAYAEAHRLGHLVPEPGPEGMADHLRWLAALPDQEVDALRARLRELVANEHGLESLADRIMGHLSELARR